MNRMKRFLVNGLLITAVSLLLRMVGVAYNVYLSRVIGAVAIGLFSLISTVYGFAVTLATSGIGLATTRLVASAVGREGERSSAVRCTVRKCFAYALFFSAISTLLLFFLAPAIGRGLLEDERCVLPLRFLALSLVPISLSSVLSGYFIAVRRVYKNAVTQVLAQGARIFGCIFLLGLFSDKSVEGACIAIALGGTIAEGVGLLLQWLLFLAERKRLRGDSLSLAQGKEIQRQLTSTALPVACSAYVRSALITVEHMLIPRGLERSGASRDLSLAAYGTVHSMVFPLVLFPAAISSSFAGLLIPEVTEAFTEGNRARIERIIGRVFSCVLTYAIGTAGIMLSFAYPLAEVIYPEAEGAGRYILMIAPLIPVMYLDTSVDAILKGLGEQFYCMMVNIVDSLLSVILVWVLLPKMGITGYILTVYFTETVNAALSIARLIYVARVRVRWFSWLIRPLISVMAATALTALLIRGLEISVTTAPALTVQLVLCASIYLLAVFCMKKSHQEKS